MVLHVMKDGTVRDSVKGLVIENEQFYRIYNSIIKKGVKK